MEQLSNRKKQALGRFEEALAYKKVIDMLNFRSKSSMQMEVLRKTLTGILEKEIIECVNLGIHDWEVQEDDRSTKMERDKE